MGDATLKALQSDDATAALARLIVDDLLGRAPSEVLDAKFTAGLVQNSLQGWLAADESEARVLEAMDALKTRLADDERRLSDVIAPEVVDGAKRIAARPYSPSRETLLAILDREPVRRLLREILRETLIEFGGKLRAPVADNRVAKSLGGFGRLAKSAARSRSGGIGALAGGLASAVSDEVERQVEKRAAEFADGAISGVLTRLADELCDPRRADEQAALRGALLDGLLGLRGVDAAKELDQMDPAELVAMLRTELRAWTSRDDFAESVAGFVDAALEQVDAATLGDLLDQGDLRDAVARPATELLTRRLRPLLRSDAFEAFFTSLPRD